jgi:hypothetical protein
MPSSLEMALGVLISCGVLWDGFATVVLPRTVSPMRRLSSRFYRRSWRIWSAVGRRIRRPSRRENFLAVYGPISVLLLLVIWGALMIVGFALVYHGLGPRFQGATGRLDFGSLLYTSGSAFLTLGLGDVTSSDPVGRLFLIVETGTGYIFLGLIVSYMPVLEQASGAREVDNLLIHSRAGQPPSAFQLLRRYAGEDRAEILQSNLREAERWMAETLQSHLSHPVVAFYRAQRYGQSWLISLATVLDGCAVLIAGGDGLPAAQARLTYRMGLRLLEDLTAALNVKVDLRCPSRLTDAELPTLLASVKSSGLTLTLDPDASRELLRLVHRYDGQLLALARWLVIDLPAWTPLSSSGAHADDAAVA